MITQRSQYRLVSPPSGILIDGGILPARDVADDGSWDELRGEDACFLREAGLRIRAYAFDTYTSGSADVAENIEASAFWRSAENIHCGATSSGRTWPRVPQLDAEKIVSSGVDHAYLADVVEYGAGGFIDGCMASGHGSEATSWMATGSFVSAGNGLVAEAVRKAYWDLSRVKGVVPSYGSPSFAEGATYGYVVWEEGNESPGHPDSSETKQFSPLSNAYILRLFNDSGRAEYTYNWDLSGYVHGQWSENPEKLSLLSPTICWVVLRIDTLLRSEAENSTIESHSDAYVARGTITSGGEISASVSAATLRSLCVDRRQGLYKSAWDMPSMTAETCRINGVSVVFYDSDIDISGIGWDWEPESEGAA